jgi:hypothetical protein
MVGAQTVNGSEVWLTLLVGTGNKFQGNQSDSNIIKIFNLLDRQDSSQCQHTIATQLWILADLPTVHYYQPGIGTYVETSSLSRKSTYGRIKSWCTSRRAQSSVVMVLILLPDTKAKDQAVGTSFGEHVMAGYKVSVSSLWLRLS